MKNNFKPTFIYIKKCGHCDLKYFGMTTKLDPIKYKGSGTFWMSHLKKHKCRDKVITLFYRRFTDQRKCVRFSILFSKIANIVNSDKWANLIIEDGLNNGVSSPNITPDIRKRMSESHFGSKHTEERKKNISESLAGKSKSPEHCRKNSESQRNRKDSPDRGRKISEANKGRKTSDEWRHNLSLALKGKIKSKTICPHCQKEGASGIMKRWHFDNCKIKEVYS